MRAVTRPCRRPDLGWVQAPRQHDADEDVLTLVIFEHVQATAAGQKYVLLALACALSERTGPGGGSLGLGFVVLLAGKPSRTGRPVSGMRSAAMPWSSSTCPMERSGSVWQATVKPRWPRSIFKWSPDGATTATQLGRVNDRRCPCAGRAAPASCPHEVGEPLAVPRHRVNGRCRSQRLARQYRCRRTSGQSSRRAVDVSRSDAADPRDEQSTHIVVMCQATA